MSNYSCHEKCIRRVEVRSQNCTFRPNGLQPYSIITMEVIVQVTVVTDVVNVVLCH